MTSLADRPESWPVVASQDLHRDDWVIALRADTVHRPGHPDEEFRRLVVEHPGSVLILAVDDAERVLCLRQYRHPAQRSFVEIPAGLCDVDGEEPLEVARRELREEAELAAQTWTHLISAYASPGVSAEVMHIFLATGLSPCARGDFVLAHEEAEMEVFWAPLDELYDAVLDGRICDAPVALAVLAYTTRRATR